jgi:Family of unknown function (DUF6519)
MAGDYSRITFDPRKHYTRVLMQQGRVQLDSDWNEQGALIAHRIETETIDVIGRTGAPKKGGNFRIGATPDGSDLTIAPGRMYVDGLLCELEAMPVTAQAAAGTSLTLPTLWLDGRELAQGQWIEVKVGNHAAQVLKIQAIAEDAPTLTLAAAIANSGTAAVRRMTTYLTQPDPPAETNFANVPDGRYLLYLDVFEREISAIDDPQLREIALGGPDTARRLETAWRVALLAIPVNTTCDTAIAPLDNATLPSTGLLAARTAPPDDEPDPCLLPPSAGYRGLENQLYRIEIQSGGQLPSGSPPTFKWSRDNAAIEAGITNVSGSTVTVTEVGKDDVLRFNVGDWVEIVDDASILSGNARALVLIDDLDDATRVVTFAGSPTIPPTGTTGLRLRKWDQSSNGIAIAADTWIDLEAGVQVRFSPGLYHSGDYWVVPARTAIADVLWPPFETPATSPIPQPPLGIRHRYARLAIVTRTGEDFAVEQDCRPCFPSLTDITCDPPDLRTHNKYLHGWGVVCGLQVQCTGEPTRVRVRPGYALDCEGYDIHLRETRTLDITTLPYQPASLPSGGSLPGGSLPGGRASLPRGGDEVCLVIERGTNGQPQFRLKDHDHKDTLAEVLDGTLLLDFYEHCLKPYVDYFRTTLNPDNTNANAVSTAQQRVIAVWNLLIQLWNPVNGGRVYLSRREHDLLLEVYGDLQRLAASSTFCTLLEGLREPPSYPFDSVPMSTIFGKSSHTRVRTSPNGSLVATAGSGDKIDLFENGRLIRQITFYSPGATVRDVAFITPTLIAAVATVAGRTFIGNHPVSGGDWINRRTVENEEIVTLAFAQSVNRLYGVSLNRGLMEIPPTAAPPVLLGEPIRAKGHIVLLEGQRPIAVLTSRVDAANPNSPKYNALTLYFLFSGEARQQEQTIGREGDDDLSFFGSANATGQPALAVVVDPLPSQTSKQLLIPSPQGTLPRLIDLGENTSIRLARIAQGDQIAIAYEDSYHVRTATPNALVPEVDIPVQICPSAIASTRDGDLFVLNTASRTMTFIPRGAQAVDIGRLREYRLAMLDAFIDLAAAIFQSVKDCFCEQLLIKCDTCTANDVVILACLEMRNGRVRQICNWTGRKYVKTFRGVEYWLSLIPILPVLRWALERFCCADFTTILRKYSPPRTGSDNFHCDDALPIIAALEAFDAKELRSEIGKQTTFLRKVARQTVVAQQPAKEVVAVDTDSLVGTNAADAESQLKASGINVVATEEYDASKRAVHLTRAVRKLRPGMNVAIVQRKGKVAYVREAKAAVDTENIGRELATTTGDVRMLRADVEAQRRILDERMAAVADAAALRTEVTALRGELENVRAANQNADKLIGELRNANTAAESRIAELNRRTTELARTAADVETLKSTVERLVRRPPNG